MIRTLVHAAARAVLCIGVLLVAGSARAENYPSRAITLVVPFQAGGPTDTVARLLAQSMGKTLGGTIVVENVAGAGGTTGPSRVAKASPDGYTLMVHHIGMATTMTLYPKRTYDSLRDFAPIGLITDVPMTLVGRADLAPANLKELLAYLQANGDKVSYAHAGIGAASHLCGMLLMSAIKTQLTTVPYQGTAGAMKDLLGGQVDLLCDQTTNTTSQIKGGKVKAYGVTTAKRVASLGDVPTLGEAGLPDFEIAIWHGLYAPKGTPEPVIDALQKALRTALADPLVVQRFAELGTEPVPADKATPAALRSKLEAEIARWAPLIQASGQYAE